jgi:hypothetical protein
MNKAMRSQLGKGLGAAGLMALLGLVANEANGANCEQINDIKKNMEDYLNGGDDLSAVAAAAGIQNLFGNQTAALNFYNELVNAR